MNAVMSAVRMRRSIENMGKVIRLLDESKKNLDDGKLFQQTIDIVDKEVQSMAPMIRAWVQQNYTASGLGKWKDDPNNHDKGLMQSEINKGVVAFRYRTTGKKSGRGWYIRFNLRPDATNYTNKNGKKRSIFQVAHALSFGAVHAKGDSHLNEKSVYYPETGVYRPKGRLGGAKMRLSLKKAALKAHALGVSDRVFKHMTFKQKMSFLYNTGGHEPVLKTWRKTAKPRTGITVNIGTTGSRFIVIPPRPWLRISEAQKATVLSRVFRAIKRAIKEGEIHVS